MTSTLQAYFQRSGYYVDVVNDPYQAIEQVRNGKYDILLLDFLMSPVCGDQVVEEIRRFNKEIYIILLTGHKSMHRQLKPSVTWIYRATTRKATALTSWSCLWSPA